MKVIIDPHVFDVMDEFYDISLKIHPTLSLETCLAKVDRLKQAMLHFASYSEICHGKPYRTDWQNAGYQEFVAEDFHFAYKIYTSSDGEKVLRFHDAVHSLLNYNPSDKISED